MERERERERERVKGTVYANYYIASCFFKTVLNSNVRAAVLNTCWLARKKKKDESQVRGVREAALYFSSKLPCSSTAVVLTQFTSCSGD